MHYILFLRNCLDLRFGPSGMP